MLSIFIVYSTPTNPTTSGASYALLLERTNSLHEEPGIIAGVEQSCPMAVAQFVFVGMCVLHGCLMVVMRSFSIRGDILTSCVASQGM